MVWGCMSSHGVGRLHIVSGTVKAMDYIEILQNILLPTARDLFGNQSWIFQDDNAPCHRAKSLVYADKPQTLDPLEDNIRRVIADIRPQMLEKVIENWTSRLDYIRASRGSPMPEIIFKM
ncbi:hypothetical protein TNCV_4776082 [Trichonephila clavipes]|nr:hypothetical protein TNCV_4776082 [Trichonephila clavipes]